MTRDPRDECAETCTSGCHSDDCEHHGHLPALAALSTPPPSLDVETLRSAIYAVSVRHDWANTTDTEDRTVEIAAEYAALTRGGS